MTAPSFRAYLAADGFVEELVRELGDCVTGVIDRLVLAQEGGGPDHAVWAENIWHDVQILPVASIGDGARQLRDIQRNWCLYSAHHHRRARLIQEKLPHVSAKPLVFGQPVPAAPLGSWTLAEENTILASPRCSAPVPNGAWVFEEDRDTPPNRAYLKLWEALSRLPRMPGPGETCLDLGACPGGWTWVLQGLGAQVISVDKAPLAPHIAALPNVRYVQSSAFGLPPADIGPVDWLFSDIICYPERLLRLVENWRASGLARNMVCTIKFQGETDHDAVRRFLDITGSFAMHLYNNKHEITWVCLGE
jgi:23S rRNA (cytidine2498-2'-O)-methyltransferase